jgi:hypothetical protein
LKHPGAYTGQHLDAVLRGKMAGLPPGITKSLKNEILWLKETTPTATVNDMKIPIAKPISDQQTWKELGLTDLRKITESYKLPEPELLSPAASFEDAVRMIEKVLGIDGLNPTKSIITPIETVTAQREKLSHLVEKRGEDRERYANYLLPALKYPLEIWKVAYDDGSFRNRYIGVFSGKRDLMVSIIANPDGSLLWNMMQDDPAGMNRQRRGKLIYKKKIDRHGKSE